MKKIIHYCWLSDDPFPTSIQRCIDTWSRVLPDYEIRRWDFSRFPRGRSAWVDEAFDARKYAFAADYIRCYALYTEGGIYLDSDVEVLRSFDPLMHLPYFLCRENGTGNVEAAVMGSEPGNPLFGRMLEYYEGRHFRLADGSLDTKPLPKVIDEVISDPAYGAPLRFVDIASPEALAAFTRSDGSVESGDVKGIVEKSADVKAIVEETGSLGVLPFDYFSPINLETRRLEQTPRTIAIHRFAATWQPWPLRLKRRLKRLLGPTLTALLISLKRTGRRRASSQDGAAVTLRSRCRG